MSLTGPQKIAMMVTSITASWISIIGSASVLLILFRSPNKLSTTYRRLMCGMSIMDLLCSIGWAIGDLPAPHGSPVTLFAYGNAGTCTAQGIIVFLGVIGTALYMASLSLYYVLTVTGYSSMHDQNVSRKLEIALHAVPILWVTVTGVFMTATNSFNFSGHVCFIAPLPLNCINDPDVECVRGARAFDYRWWFAFFPLFICCGFIILCMLFLIWTVLHQWRRTDRFHGANVIQRYRQQSMSPHNDEEQTRRRRRSSLLSLFSPQDPSDPSQQHQRRQHRPDEVTETMNQALLYIAGFLLTYIIPLVNIIVRMRTGKAIIVLYLIANFLSPLQGFFNFFIFIRPRLAMLRHSHPNMRFSKLLWIAVTSRVETARLGRRRSTHQLQQNSYSPRRRGFTARELYLQQRANEAAATESSPELLESGNYNTGRVEDADGNNGEKRNNHDFIGPASFIGPANEKEDGLDSNKSTNSSSSIEPI
jgi:hypothetical protein